jgi:AbiV family abortive infection protein
MTKKRAAPTLTFDQLVAYGDAIAVNGRALVADAQVLFDAGRLPRSYALCTLAIEESHKLPLVWRLMMDLLAVDAPDWDALAGANSHTYKLTMAVASTAAIPQVMAPEAPGLEPAALQKFLTDSKPYVKEFNYRKLAAIYTDLDAQGNAVLPDITVDVTLTATMLKTARSTVESMALIHPHAPTVLKQLAASAGSARPTADGGNSTKADSSQHGNRPDLTSNPGDERPTVEKSD